jgi:hypothetical protein
MSFSRGAKTCPEVAKATEGISAARPCRKARIRRLGCDRAAAIVDMMLACVGGLMSQRLYMVIENFKNEDAVPVYRRFRDHGRLAPAGLSYVSSWVSDKLDRCYQLMETADRTLLDQWMANWSDIVDFEVHAVISSKEAAEKMAQSL